MCLFVCSSDKWGRGVCVPLHIHEEVIHRVHQRWKDRWQEVVCHHCKLWHGQEVGILQWRWPLFGRGEGDEDTERRRDTTKSSLWTPVTCTEITSVIHALNSWFFGSSGLKHWSVWCRAGRQLLASFCQCVSKHLCALLMLKLGLFYHLFKPFKIICCLAFITSLLKPCCLSSLSSSIWNASVLHIVYLRPVCGPRHSAAALRDRGLLSHFSVAYQRCLSTGEDGV